MYASGTIIELLPDWYLIEREAEKTIEKLNSAKELDYYITSSDEYLRRLAILRLKKLGLKESGGILKEIMDDPVESHANKQVSAWALKSLLVGNDSDYMLNSRYLANFTGREKYEELFSVSSGQEVCSVRFQFSSSQYFTAFKINDEDSVLEKNIYFESDFDIKQWLNDLRSSLKIKVKNLPLCIVKSLKNVSQKAASKKAATKKAASQKAASEEPVSVSKSHIKAIRKHKSKDSSNETPIQSVRESENTDIFSRRSDISRFVNSRPERQYDKTQKQYGNDYRNDYDRIRKDLYGRPSFFARVKKGVYQLFYFLFYPLRLARKHKFAFLCLLLSIYAFFTYFSYGRAITNKYAGFDLQEVQSQIFRKAGALYYQALNEINRITGINEWKKNNESKQASEGILKTADISITKGEGLPDGTLLFTVTAKDGLNIRTAPDPASKKVGSTALPYGTSVTFLSSADSESAGIEWFYIKAEDGRVGWVSSKYLRKAEDK